MMDESFTEEERQLVKEILGPVIEQMTAGLELRDQLTATLGVNEALKNEVIWLRAVIESLMRRDEA